MFIHCLLAYLILSSGENRWLAGQPSTESRTERSVSPLPAFLIVEELQSKPGDDELRGLLKKRHNAIAVALEQRFKEWEAGRGTLGFLIRDAEYLRKARLDLCIKDKDRLTILQQYVDWTKVIEVQSRSQFENGRLALHDWKETEYYLHDAQIEYLRAQHAAKGP